VIFLGAGSHEASWVRDGVRGFLPGAAVLASFGSTALSVLLAALYAAELAGVSTLGCRLITTVPECQRPHLGTVSEVSKGARVESAGRPAAYGAGARDES
jgi:hypothetical protein